MNKCLGMWSARAIVLITVIVFSFSTGCSRGNGIKPMQVQTSAQDESKLEGVEWYLREVNESPVSTLRGERSPFIKFDGTKKQANGFNGCNNFSAGYEIDRSSLKFGPVAATRRSCEGTAGEVELKFMQALDKTRSWEIKDGLLIILDNADVLAIFRDVREDGAEIDLKSDEYGREGRDCDGNKLIVDYGSGSAALQRVS